MESSRPIAVSVEFKAMLKVLLEKLSLLLTMYESENFGHDYLSVFTIKVKFEDKFGSHEQYGSKAYTEKEAKNDAALRVVRLKENTMILL